MGIPIDNLDTPLMDKAQPGVLTWTGRYANITHISDNIGASTASPTKMNLAGEPLTLEKLDKITAELREKFRPLNPFPSMARGMRSLLPLTKIELPSPPRELELRVRDRCAFAIMSHHRSMSATVQISSGKPMFIAVMEAMETPTGQKLKYWTMREKRLYRPGYRTRLIYEALGKPQPRRYHNATGDDRRFCTWCMAQTNVLELSLKVKEIARELTYGPILEK